MRFSKSVGEPSRTYPKWSDDGGRRRPVGPIIRPVGTIWVPLGFIFDRCVRVVVPFPKSINSCQTESGWGSYARFTEPHSATDIFWFWTPNMAIDISVSIISMSSLQCCTLILHLRCFFQYNWDTSWSPMTWQFLLFSRLVPANHNFTKTHGNH
jgi:hypothetical protein